MKIIINTDSYNERRYGRPYIAIVDFKTNPKGDCTWGDWVGHPGQSGILVIDANPHDIIMKGQKDNRGRGSAPEYGMVEEDGTIEWCDTKAKAYALSLALAKP